MYNLRVKDYRDGSVQTAIYTNPVYTGKKEKSNNKLLNPFDGKPCRIVSDFKLDREICLKNSMKRAKNKIYDLSRANKWDWFVTITFSPEKVDRYDYNDCVKKLSVWLNNLRKSAGLSFKYIVVPERHKDGAFHFHGLFTDSPALGMKLSGKFTRNSQPIYNISKYKFGYTTATRVNNNDAVTKYITKYTTKELMEHTYGKKKYWRSRNLQEPEIYKTMMDRDQLYQLHDDIVSENPEFFKMLNYMINDTPCAVFYYERHVDDGIGYDPALFEVVNDDDF